MDKDWGSEYKRSKKNLYIKLREFFLKNKFAVMSGFMEGQNFFGWFWSSHFSVSFNKENYIFQTPW